MKKGRQIAVHAGEIRQRQIVLAPVDLEPAAGIGAAVGEHLVADPIGEAGGALREPLALRPSRMPADQSRLAAFAPEPRTSRMMSPGIVLPVAVHGGDHWRRRRDHACAECGALASALAVAEIAQGLVAPSIALISAPVPSSLASSTTMTSCKIACRHGGNRLLDEPADIAGLVIGRDDDGDTHRRNLWKSGLEAKQAPTQAGSVASFHFGAQHCTGGAHPQPSSRDRLDSHKAARPALLRSWTRASLARPGLLALAARYPWGAPRLRLFALYFAKTDLFFDEAQYWLWSRDLAFGYFSKPPLIAWLIRLATEDLR